MKAKYLGQCDRLRKTMGGEANWQEMMRNKKPVSFSTFARGVDTSAILDDGETFAGYMGDNPGGELYKSVVDGKTVWFLQVGGFEFIFGDVGMRFGVRVAHIARLAAKPRKVSLKEAQDLDLFGPLYHGTSEVARKSISGEGFKVFVGPARTGPVTHGYVGEDYYEGIPAPIHTLGFGIYLTTVKNIAKEFAGGTTKGMKTYYARVPRLATINFGSPKNMMKWWEKNGYDWADNHDRLEATKHMTQELRGKYDAVWFKGRGIRRLLDGDQVCVYDANDIYELDNTAAKPGEPGARVRRCSDGMIGTILKAEDAEEVRRKFPRAAETWLDPVAKKIFTVSWRKGGVKYNVLDTDVELKVTRKRKQHV